MLVLELDELVALRVVWLGLFGLLLLLLPEFWFGEVLPLDVVVVGRGGV